MRNSVSLWLAVSLLGAAPVAARAQTAADLRAMSIDELADIDVSSVTKTPETLASAPGAIYVITHEDIVRSGAQSVPEMLRLAPNLQVMQTSASRYVVTARGFSGSSSAQNFSNKLLVLIDGRSVYTPLYSGVYWDMQEVLSEDIDRIEVISGPGATLWGANAVNGVVNIITRKASETQGGLLEASAGDQGRRFALRYGGQIGETLSWRLYGRSIAEDDTFVPSGAAAGARTDDDWRRVQGGFRLDWTPSERDSLTLQGDAYDGSESQAGRSNDDIGGRNLLLRWNRTGADGSALQVQGYYDRTRRDTDGAGFTFNTYDLDMQHSFALGQAHQIVWGGGVRISDYETRGIQALHFSPAGRTLHLYNVFAQDSISLTDDVKLIAGLKLEDDPYSGAALLPSLRATWQASESTMLWATVSRAIRAPTPFDRDLVEQLGAMVFLTGGEDFRSEKLTAYEIGARVRPSPRASFSVSAFYNVYDDLRSVATTPVTVFPLHWANGMKGDTYGFEAWADYRAAPWWRLSAGVAVLEKKLKFKTGASTAAGLAQAGDDPKQQASLRSFMNLGDDVTLDANLRYVGALPDPRVPAYTELSARLGWQVTEQVTLALSGLNLLHDRHQEFPAPDASSIPRSVAVDLQWRF
jgi:iron complex outermembrane receptor protein